MTFPDRPLNPPHPSPALTAERRSQDRALLRFKLINACQQAIQAIALIASDDNDPDEDMSGEWALKQMQVIQKAVMDIDRPLVEWTSESAFWAEELNKLERESK